MQMCKRFETRLVCYSFCLWSIIYITDTGCSGLNVSYIYYISKKCGIVQFSIISISLKWFWCI